MPEKSKQLPEVFLQSLTGLPGFNKDSFCAIHNSSEQVTSIRVHPQKKAAESAYGFQKSTSVAWTSLGWYLQERPSFTLDPLFHAGAYYVQEASSMFLEQALKQTINLSSNIRVLDLCAAPGGKSTHIQSLISENSLLVSNEVIKSRSAILQENLTKWGGANIVVTQNDPQDFSRLHDFFDVIVVDAPCSGSGMFRKDPEAIQEWSTDHVALCNQRQQRILSDVLPSLKEGGMLIYSTCSYSKQENEEVVDWLIQQQGLESVRLSIDQFEGIVATQSDFEKGWGYRFYPNLIKGEGFFMATFQKKRSSSITKSKTKEIKLEKLPVKSISSLIPWLQNNFDGGFFLQHNEVILIPLSLQKDIEILKGVLYLRKAGTILGSLVRDELIPAHSLAMSVHQSDNIPSLSLDLEQSRQYLRHQVFELPEVKKGWNLIKYAGISLGFVKCITGRVNNYYPRDWRILNK